MSKDLGLKRRLREASKEERTAILDGLPHEVGFGKPPRHTRFTAGNRAGRRGRPKGSENLATILDEESAVRIEVTEGGKRRRLSKRRVAMRQVLNKAASGDIKAAALYVEFLRKTGQLQPAASGELPVLDARDLQTIERLAAFFDSAATAGSQENGGEP
jgi:Family of unknown function (DUF5681)